MIADLPFMSYQVSDEDAVRNAGRLVKEGGADAVKLEGAGPSLDRIRAIVASGIPVMGHLGLTPQTATTKGGHKAQGRQAEAALELLADALAVQAAGCFGSCSSACRRRSPTAISRRLASSHRHRLGRRLRRPGAGLHDMLGIRTRPPRRASSSTTPRWATVEAVSDYAAEVRGGEYPAAEHTYSMPHEELEAFEGAIARRPDR